MRELCGIVPVNKPSGWTSFDVVAKLRRILGIRRIGHSGTLDPTAVGVLPILVGKATRACDILPDSDKTYRAGFRLGITTDTQDITGRVLEKFQGSGGLKISEKQLTAVFPEFTGSIMQVPPMYSAVKVGGVKLCDAARRGESLERQAKRREVRYIKLLSYDEASASGEIETSVSKGTYIRTLINDIGERLGCGGAMTSLIRTYACGFGLTDCISLEELSLLAEQGRAADAVLPVESVFTKEYKSVFLDGRSAARYKNGVRLRLSEASCCGEPSEGEKVCVFGRSAERVENSGDNEFLGIASFCRSEGLLKSFRNFY